MRLRHNASLLGLLVLHPSAITARLCRKPTWCYRANANGEKKVWPWPWPLAYDLRVRACRGPARLPWTTGLPSLVLIAVFLLKSGQTDGDFSYPRRRLCSQHEIKMELGTNFSSIASDWCWLVVRWQLWRCQRMVRHHTVLVRMSFTKHSTLWSINSRRFSQSHKYSMTSRDTQTTPTLRGQAVNLSPSLNILRPFCLELWTGYFPWVTIAVIPLASRKWVWSEWPSLPYNICRLWFRYNIAVDWCMNWSTVD